MGDSMEQIHPALQCGLGKIHCNIRVRRRSGGNVDILRRFPGWLAVIPPAVN
jgi:hypothetical protein